MVIDVDRCMDCNDCFLADKDEFTGNDFPPYSVAQPWSGHRWMNIMRTERGQYPLVQVAYRPTPCLHCDDAPCIKDSPAGTVYKRDDGLVIIDPVKAEGPSRDRQDLSLRRHLLERRGPGGAEVHRLRPPHGRGLEGDPLLAGLPGGSHQAGAGRRRRDGRVGGRRGAGGPEARSWGPSRGSTTRTCTCSTRRSSPATWSSATPTSAREGAKATVTPAAGSRWGEATASNYGDFYVDSWSRVGSTR